MFYKDRKIKTFDEYVMDRELENYFMKNKMKMTESDEKWFPDKSTIKNIAKEQDIEEKLNLIIVCKLNDIKGNNCIPLSLIRMLCNNDDKLYDVLLNGGLERCLEKNNIEGTLFLDNTFPCYLKVYKKGEKK